MAAADAPGAAAIVGADTPVAAPPVVGRGFRWLPLITIADSLSAGVAATEGARIGLRRGVGRHLDPAHSEEHASTDEHDAGDRHRHEADARAPVIALAVVEDGRCRRAVARGEQRLALVVGDASAILVRDRRGCAARAAGPSVGTTPLATSIGERRRVARAAAAASSSTSRSRCGGRAPVASRARRRRSSGPTRRSRAPAPARATSSSAAAISRADDQRFSASRSRPFMTMASRPGGRSGTIVLGGWTSSLMIA